MRISSLFVDGFGMFHNLSLEDLPGGFILFSGDNEAGKSTCLGFIRDMLFGFRDRRSKDNEYPPLAGGALGGRIAFVTERFGEILLERKAGRKGGLVSLAYCDGRKAGEEALRDLLGGATPELYRNVYAFSLSELQSLKTLENDAVKSALYGAGMGTGALDLSAATTSINKKLDELFKPGGRNPELNRKLRDLEEVREKLREARQELKRYDEAYEGLRRKTDDIEACRSAVRSLNRQKEQVDVSLKAWDDALLLRAMERDLADLPLKIENFPARGVDRLDRLTEKIEAKEAALDALRGDRDETLRELKRTHSDEDLLEQSEVVRELISGKAAYVEDLGAIVPLRQRIEAADKGIATALSELGRDWTEEKLRTLDRSLFAREEIERRRQVLDGLKSARVHAENSVAERRKAFEAAAREEEEAKKEVERMPAAAREADEETIEALRKGRDQFAWTVAELPALRKDRDREKERLREAILEIGAAWDEQDVASFDCSLGAREKVETFERTCADIEGEIEKAEGRIGAADRERQDACEMVDRKTREIEKIAPVSRGLEELASRKESLRALRALAAMREKLSLKIDYERELLADKEEEKRRCVAGLAPRPHKAARLSSLAAVLIGVVILLISLGRGIGAGYVLAVVFLVAGIAGLLFSRRASKASSARGDAGSRVAQLDLRISAAASVLEEAEGARRAVDRKIEDLTRRLGMAGQPASEDLDLGEVRADEEMKRAEKLSGLLEERKMWEERAEKASKAVEEWEKKREAEGARLASARQEWEAYLLRLRLAPHMTTRSVRQVFAVVENVRGRIKALAELEERIGGLKRRRAAYLSIAAGAASMGDVQERDPAVVLPLVDELLKRDREISEGLHERASAEGRLKDRSERATAADKALDEAEALRDKAVGDEEKGAGAWRGWLLAAGFDGTLSPSTAMEAVHKTDEAVRMIDGRDNLTARLKICERSVRQYRESARNLLERLGRATAPDERLPSAVEALEQDLEEAKTARTRKEGLQKNLDDIAFRMDRQKQELAASREELACLLSEGGAVSGDEFRIRADLYEKRRRLLAEAEKTESNIRKLSGAEDASALSEELGRCNKDELKTRSDELASRLADIDEKLHQAYDEKARLSREMESLASADAISRFRLDEEKIIEEIRLQAYLWGSYAIARRLLAEARKRFQEERQPKVISDAAGFFRLITGGRYEKIIAPIGEDTLEVVSREGRTKRPEQLSRGTAEQLYLALRFGYITNFTAGGETLPVVMDEILVNFDKTRAAQAASAILALAQTHQVVYFTCHPETAALFQGLKEDIGVYEMKDGRINRA